MKTGNPKESAGKDKTAFSLRKKALKKNPSPVKIDLLVTNGLMKKIREILSFEITKKKWLHEMQHAQSALKDLNETLLETTFI